MPSWSWNGAGLAGVVLEWNWISWNGAGMLQSTQILIVTAEVTLDSLSMRAEEQPRGWGGESSAGPPGAQLLSHALRHHHYIRPVNY